VAATSLTIALVPLQSAVTAEAINSGWSQVVA